VIACVGEVGWRKGQEHVLTAAVQLRARFPRAVWLIAGEGDGRAALEDRARQLRILAGDDPAAGGVRFLGFRRDVPALLAASDLLVLPSRSEGFPNTLLEGMALGLPVAASTADGIGELVVPGETGLLHPVDDVPHFVDDVATLLADPDLRQRLGAAARERAERVFGEDAIMDQVEAALAAWPQGHGSGRA
jgi:glycosyltransferase involved in cell wall biosynthesis